VVISVGLTGVSKRLSSGKIDEGQNHELGANQREPGAETFGIKLFKASEKFIHEPLIPAL